MAEKDTRNSKQIKVELDAANKKVADTKTKLGSATPTNYDQLLKEYNAATKQRDIIKGLFDTASERESGAAKETAKRTKESTAANKRLQDIGEYETRLIREYVDRAKKAFDRDPSDKTKFETYQSALGSLAAKFGEYASKGIVLSGAPVAAVSAPPSTVTDRPPPTPPPVLDRTQRGETSTATLEPDTDTSGATSTVKVLRTDVDKALKEQGLADTPENRKKVRLALKAAQGTADGVVDTGDADADALRKAWVTAQLAARGWKDTPENRKILRGEYKPAVVTDWEPLFKSQYPQYAWMFTDAMKTKYPDLFQLFKDASADPEYNPDLFARRFDGTSWYTELKTGSKARDLMASIGTFSWGSGNLAKFLTTANQYSWTGATLKQEAYKELFRKGDDGKDANPNAVGEVRASTPYLRLKKIGTNFLSPMDDARIVESLTGGISEDDVLRLARERAKAMYPHLVAQIDAGLTLADLAYDYRRTAAKTLELSDDQIDMADGKYNIALKFGEGGKERMMGLGEWETRLRTDPKYKFFGTKQANRDATDLGLQIAKAFGKTGA